VGRRQIEIAMRDVWRERRATNLDGRHVVRPFSTGFALDHPAVDSLDGQRLSRNSRDQIPSGKVLDCGLASVGEDFRATQEAPTRVSGMAAASPRSGPTLAAGTRDLRGSQGGGYDRRGKDTPPSRSHFGVCADGPVFLARVHAYQAPSVRGV